MPPKVKVLKEQIIEAALDVVREQGADALNARAVAKKIGCSTQPVFSNYPSMDALRTAVILEAKERYRQFIRDEMAEEEYPPYKASGMAYIRFAREETELFRLLFMRNRSQEKITEERDEVAGLIRLISEKTGLDAEDAYLFHIEMWICVHGIATMIATSYLEWNEEQINRILTDAYQGLRKQFCQKGGE